MEATSWNEVELLSKVELLGKKFNKAVGEYHANPWIEEKREDSRR